MFASPLTPRGTSRVHPSLVVATRAVVTAVVAAICIAGTLGDAWARAAVPPPVGASKQAPRAASTPIPRRTTATTFSNASPIPVADATGFGSVATVGQGNPYPSTIAVSGLAGFTSKVTVTLSGVDHSYMGDLDVLLVSPSGQALVLTAVNGTIQPPGPIDLTFDDAGPPLPGQTGPLTTGTYHPTDGDLCTYYTDCTPASQGYPAPGPAVRPTATSLATFNSSSPNGTWNLYVLDRGPGDTGTIGGGWSISIDTVNPVHDITTALDYPTIQAAINDPTTSSGNTIVCDAGTYGENVTLSKAVILKGAQAGVAACGRTGAESVILAAVPTTAALTIPGGNGIVVDGFTIDQGNGNPGGTAGAVNQTLATTTLQLLNLKIVNFKSQAMWFQRASTDMVLSGNSMDGSAEAAAAQTVFFSTNSYNGLQMTNNCITHGTGYGWFVDGGRNVGTGAANPVISGNTFSNNASSGVNAGSRSLDHATVSNNTFANNGFDGFQGGPSNSSFTGNHFTNNGRSGLALTSFGSTSAGRGAVNVTVSNNYFTGNGFTQSGGAGYLAGSPQPAGNVASLHANHNDIVGNAAGATYAGTELFDVGCNWWGDINGPNDPPTNTNPAGDKLVASNAMFSPWLDGSIAGSPSCNQVIKHTITASAGLGGSIAPSGSVIVPDGSAQSFAIAGDDCHVIGDVVVDGISRGATASYTFSNVTTDHTIAASFTLKQYTVFTSPGAGGSITPSGTVAVNCGDNATFTIAPDACRSIADVVVDGVSRGATASYTFANVTASHTISATFALISYVIQASAGPGGTIGPSGAVTVACDGSQTFAIAPDGCHTIADVVVDGVPHGASPSYTFTHVSADHTIEATFAQLTTTSAVATDVNPSEFGGKVNLVATVTPTAATGDVEFFDGGTSLGAVPLDGSGHASLSVTSFEPGKHELTSQYLGDGCYLASTSPIYSQVVNPAPSATSIDAQPPTTACGDKVTLTATVTPTGATGTVTFLDGVTALGSSPVDALGHATLSVTDLSPGSHSLSASYSGDVHNAASTSPAVGHQVNAGPTTTILAADVNPSVCGQKVNLTATVTPAGATGTVTFMEGATPLGSSPVDALGHATLSVTTLGPGKHELSAQYSGGGCFGASASALYSQVVNPAPSAVSVTTDPNPSVCGGKVTLTAVVSPVGATGTVTFVDGATTLGAGPVDALGHATLSVTTLEVGKHELTAQYSGDACDAPSTSASYSHIVNGVPTTVSLASDANPSQCAGKVNLTATVTPAGASGTVAFLEGATTLGTGIVDALGHASLSLTTLPVGKHELTAQYSGDACDLPSASGTFSQVVDPIPTQTTLDAQPPASACGDKVTLTATVTPAGATGAVTFLDGATSLGSAPVDGTGHATLSVTTLPVGTHSLTASYAGDGCSGPSVSSKVAQEVDAIPTTTTLTSDANPVKHLGKVNLMAHVDPAGVTGTVTFFNGATPLGSAPVDGSGDASLSVTTLPVGTSTLTAHYGGDGCHAASVSPGYDETVIGNAAPTVTIVAPDGGELLLVNSMTTLQWVATDDHAVVSVSLYISRDHGVTYTPIALDIANTGSYAWLVAPPGTNTGSGAVFSAVFRVVAKDAEGQTGENVSDNFFAIQNTGLNAVGAALPLAFALAPPTPNPTGGSIHTEFALPRTARVRLSVIDLQGRELAVLADGEYAAGRYPASWNGHADRGSLRAGLYFIRFKTPDGQFLRRVVVTR